jgi:hypothetical protein
VERFQKTPGGSPLRKTTCLWHGGPPGPWWAHLLAYSLCRFSTALRSEPTHLFKSVWSKGWRLLLRAIYTYLHLPPRTLIHYHVQILRAEKLETLVHISTRIRASNQEKISPP